MRYSPLAEAVFSFVWWPLRRRAYLGASGNLAAERSGVWMQAATLAGLMLLAAALRFAEIGSRSLWFDEAFSARIANRPLIEVIAFSMGGEPHPPLYYLVLSVWMGAFGTGEAALRSLGAVASILTVGGIWWLGRRLAGPFVGALSAFLTAVAPLHVSAAQEARMYPLLGLLMVASWAFLLVAAEGRRWAWAAYIAATVLALYTHYFAVLMLAGQAIFVLAAVPQIRQRWLTSQLLILICYMPWLSVLMQTLFSGLGWPFFRPPLSLHTLTTLFGLLSFGGNILGFDGYFGGATAPVVVQAVILIPFLVLALAGALYLRRTPRSLWLVVGYFVVPLGVALGFSLRYNVFYPRYFSFLVPPFALLMACGMAALCARVAPASRRAVALGLVLAFLGFSAPALNKAYANTGFSNWRAAAALVAAGAGPDDLIMLIPGLGFIPFLYYYSGPQRLEGMTPREFWDIAAGRARDDPAADTVNQQAFRAYASRHRVMWIITTRPLPVGASERLKRLLTGVYDVEGGADFKGVWVIKAVRHQP